LIIAILIDFLLSRVILAGLDFFLSYVF